MDTVPFNRLVIAVILTAAITCFLTHDRDQRVANGKESNDFIEASVHLQNQLDKMLPDLCSGKARVVPVSTDGHVVPVPAGVTGAVNGSMAIVKKSPKSSGYGR